MTARPIDIRTVTADDYWKAFEDSWTSLLSYRYLGRVHRSLDLGVEGDPVMALRHDMRHASGGIMAAVLCIFAPESGGMSDDEYVPNPVIASMQIVDQARGVKRLRAIPETIRIGRQMGFSRTLIVDDDDTERVIAISEGMGVSLGSAPANFERVQNDPMVIEDSPELPPLHSVFKATCDHLGIWRLPELSLESASPDAALHLGPQHILIETAACEAAQRMVHEKALHVESYHCMFVSRGKVGPFRAQVELHSGSGTRIGARVTLHDEGNEDRVVTNAAITFGTD